MCRKKGEVESMVFHLTADDGRPVFEEHSVSRSA
jgi:hypothetical protein